MNNLNLFNDLPATDLPKKKKRTFENVLSTQLKRLMLKGGITPSILVREALIPMSTLCEWINGDVETQRLDDNIKKVARFFGVSVDYLAYGTPENQRDLDMENDITDVEDYIEEFSEYSGQFIYRKAN
ncbi:MAG: helix-turn-helix domain-containing protein [Bacteriovoracaceae bacterium]